MKGKELQQGFLLLEEREIGGKRHRLYRHERTGARLIEVECDDDNKVFGVGFRTPPKGSTGVCHILEHSVLNGSKKYRTKEPFMDMLRTSLQTFLNAMTYPDKTLYPVASRNDKDFNNLVDVYLDAVFNPLVGEKKEIFLQEGWHINPPTEEEPASYSGVVYNEMKGALSSPEDQIDEQINQRLLPDTIYALNSGGDPFVIPTLSYEDFLDYHHNYYSPSNAYLYLYGKVDFEHFRKKMDEEYLLGGPIQVDSMPELQPRFEEPRIAEETYSLAEGDPTSDRTYLSYSVLFHPDEDICKASILADLFEEILVDSEASILKDVLVGGGYVEDLYSQSYLGRELQWSLVLKNLKEDKKEEVLPLLEETLRKAVEEGIDKDLLQASLNKIEYRVRDRRQSAHRGLNTFIDLFDDWLYDRNPLHTRLEEDVLQELRKEINGNFFEEFLQREFLDNPHKSIVFHLPEPGKNQRKEKEDLRKLNDYYKALPEKEREQIRLEKEKLDAYQNREDSPEEKATIPTLSLKDLDGGMEEVPYEKWVQDGITVYSHPAETAGLVYADFYFDLSHLETEELPYVRLISDLQTLLDTENYDYQTLSKEIFLQTGGLSTRPVVYEGDNAHTRPHFYASIRTAQDLDQGLELMREVLFSTKFEDEKRIRELLQMILSRQEMNLYDSAHLLLISRAMAQVSLYQRIQDLTSGLGYFLFLKNFKKNFEKEIQKLREVSSKMYQKRGLILNVTTDPDLMEEALDHSYQFLEGLQLGEKESLHRPFEEEEKREVFVASSDVNYFSIAGTLPEETPYCGQLTVLASILSKGFLYNEIRAKGGAYGAGLLATRMGQLATYSYRDPNVRRTLETYLAAPEAARKLDLTDQELEQFIIGTMTSFDPLLNPRQKSVFHLSLEMSDRSYEDIEKSKQEAISTTQDDLHQLADGLAYAFSQKHYAALVNPARFEEEKDLFDQVISLRDE